MTPFPYKRIVVVGVTGSGKSMLAERMACKLGLDFIELDAIYWKPDWVGSSNDEFRDKVEKAIQAPGWAVAGNYSVTRDIVWQRAEAIVWLDYPFFLVLVRLLRRIWIRWRTKELLWGTNYESLWVHCKLWSKDSLINWLFKTYWRRKRQYPFLMALPQYAHLKAFRFKTPSQTDTWIESINR